MMLDWQPVYLSIKIAILSTICVCMCAVPIAYFMRYIQFRGKTAFEAFITLPLVLPPVVTGFILLILVGKNGPIGSFLNNYLGVQIVFTPYAAVLAGTVVAFPLMYQAVKAAFQNIDTTFEDAARTLGANNWRVFLTITVPLAWQGIVAGLILSFSRTLGEFGATMMVAGNIPGKTQTLPLAIYFASESNDLTTAGVYVLIISAITFFMIYGVTIWSKKNSVY